MLRGVAASHIVADDNFGCHRLSSALFKNNPKRQGYLSFNSQTCIEARGGAPADYMRARSDSCQWIGAVSVSVEQFRSFDPGEAPNEMWKIGMVPLDHETPPDPCHGAVWGTITKSKADAIRRTVDWLIEVDGVVIDETQ